MKPETAVAAPTPEAIPHNASLGVLLAYVIRCGWNAARRMVLPALLIQLLMLLLVIGYYAHWRSTIILETLGQWRAHSKEIFWHGDLFFDFVSTGLAAGVFAELCKVYLTQRGRWHRKNLQDAAFKFFVIGAGGLCAGLFYALQSSLFGAQANVGTVAVKVLVDQFVLNPLLSAPFPCYINYCLINGFSAASLRDCFNLRFYLVRVMPLLFTTWCFWLPMVSLIYSLPSLLQFSMFLCASTIWGLIFTALVNPDDRSESNPGPLKIFLLSPVM